MVQVESVAAVEVIQAKPRWLFDHPGYVPGGYRTRRKLLAKRVSLPGVSWSHVTLTYDPKRWASPEACYVASRRKRHVGEFMRRLRLHLGDLQYFRVIEFQKSGMPHYHVLIDRTWISHALLTELWGWGFVFITPAGYEQFTYVAKYITKGVDPPDWLVQNRYRSDIRLSSTSRGFWGESEPRRGRAGDGPPRRAVATIQEVRANPRRYLRTMMRLILSTGEVMYRHVKTDISTTVDILGDLGFLGGHTAGTDGLASLVLPAGRSVLLDQLLHCGDGSPGVVVDSG